jgi:hypothetical protein
MKRTVAAASVFIALAGGVFAGQQRRRVVQPAASESEKPANYSPLGFDDLRAYEQAYPGSPEGAQVAQASAAKYWVYQGIAVRGAGPGATGAWLSLGPDTTMVSDSTEETVSGRVSALLVSPRCELKGRCRLWVGTAGGGVWRTDDAMNTTDPKWRWVGYGLGTNNIGSLATDPGDRTGNTIYVGTGETNQPNNSGAGTGVYRSTDGGDHWTRVPTAITDTAVSPSTIDFTSTRGISTIVVDPTDSRTVYVATTSAMRGMTAVR